MKHERGFTIVEIIVAITVLSIGLLGLASTSAMVTRMIGQGQRSAVAATFAAKRMEQLRNQACTAQTPGAESLYRGSTRVAINTWSYSDAGNKTYRVLLTTTYVTVMNRTRTDTVETAVSCLI